MTDSDLGGILGRTLTVTCAACGAQNAPRAEQCEACGAAVGDDDDDEGGISFMAADPDAVAAAVGGKRSVPLERAKNYIALRDAGENVLAGKMGADEYRTIMQRLKGVAATGLKVFQSDVARQRFATLPDHEKAAAERMERGFQQLHEGVLRMGAYLETGDAADVREGWAIADRGWVDIDEAQETALKISEERT